MLKYNNSNIILPLEGGRILLLKKTRSYDINIYVNEYYESI